MASRKGVLVRMDPATEAKVKRLAQQAQVSMADVVAVAIDRLADMPASTLQAGLESLQAKDLGEAMRADDAALMGGS